MFLWWASWWSYQKFHAITPLSLCFPTEILLTLKVAGCFFLQLTGLTCSRCLPAWRAASICFHPTDLPSSPARARWADGPGPRCPGRVPSAAAGGAASCVDRRSAARVRTTVSLFTAFTLVQLRSLLQSKCWQADFIPVSDWMYLNVCI